jgi:hypothetical protein
LCVGDAEALAGFAPPGPAFVLTCEARVACAVALEVPGLWVCSGGDDDVLGDAEEVEPDGEGDGLGDVVGDVGVEVGDGLELGEPDGLPDADVLGSDDRDGQPGEDVPGEFGPMPAGPLL